MSTNLSKTYNPKDSEDKIYKTWLKSGFLNPDNLKVKSQKLKSKSTTQKSKVNAQCSMLNAQCFSIAMPPPNATGELHIGHALFITLQDIMTRYHRMKGDTTLWLPGTDHASIATQNKVEKILKKERKTKYDLGREKFLKRVEEFVEDSKDTIRKQIRKMGASCDWSRERYTLDKGLSRAVQAMFIRMYNDGLIYRGDRIVNWCLRCESTLADDEVEYKTVKNRFYYLKYGPVVIGTARPETKFLDKTIIVHPQDKRYKSLVGKKLKVPWINEQVEAQVIADKSADMSIGTGAMTLTPAHSFIDFDLAKKYKLPIIQIIDKKGRLTKQAGEFAGLKANQAREQIIEKLQAKGLVDHIDEDYEHNLSVCYRCNTPIEPLVSKQWFVSVNSKFKIQNSKLRKIIKKDKASLKEIALSVVKKGEIKIIPVRFIKTYFHWMNNLRDWCISRQIWFGHRIPVWYCCGKIKNQKSKLKNNNVTIRQCNNVIVNLCKPDKCPKCQSTELKQDPDTLDTWFSSGLWTFSTLGWPEKTKDLKKFHPTTVMETAYDILFFWVARMILLTAYALGEIPFKIVYLHGLVRDKQGRKMSKSLGNGIDPLEMIEKFGADAVRLALITGNTPGNDMRMYEEKIAGFKKYINKVWNIARYVISRHPEEPRRRPKPASRLVSQLAVISAQSRAASRSLATPSYFCEKGRALLRMTLSDKWILFELNDLIDRVNKNMKEFQFSRVSEDIYEFIWHKLADWYIEAVKIEDKPHQPELSLYILRQCLVMLHPFMPFVTERLWQEINQQLTTNNSAYTKVSADKQQLLIIEPWVKNINFKIDKKQAKEFIKIQNIITAIRNKRAEQKIEPKEILDYQIERPDKLIVENKVLIEKMGRVKLGFTLSMCAR